MTGAETAGRIFDSNAIDEPELQAHKRQTNRIGLHGTGIKQDSLTFHLVQKKGKWNWIATNQSNGAAVFYQQMIRHEWYASAF